MTSGAPPPPMRVFVLAGSFRAGSLNIKLASLVARLIEEAGADVEEARIGEFGMPVYDGDLESAGGIPAGTRALCERLEKCDAFVIASPEYNASVPGGLKNMIDWVSRTSPQPFKDKQTMLVSASPSMVGGNRGLWALRVPLEHLGSRVYPDMFSLASAHEAFKEDGNLFKDDLQERLRETLTSFLRLVEADTRYVCLRRRWYEFLGDQTGAHVTQRAEG
ncbi:NADPH-dependent FMN reductase [Streptomyces gamaensis]|uniref:NADPH-dependent FMN reductase n=1 Tax=Streptomyces gamaensis TaxID=1763542 RepID=A0ABW0Z9M8_9ACTN